VRSEPSTSGGSEVTPAPLGVATLAVGLVALVGSLFVFGHLAEDVHEQEANALDAVANPVLHSIASPPLDTFMAAATFLGSTPTLPVLFVLTATWLVLRDHRREALFLAVAIGGSFVIDQALKLVFHRPRPQLAWAHVQPEYSFPSGHAMNSLTFYLALAIVVWIVAGRRPGRIAVAVAIVLALVIGVSRIYFGYHYLTDVVGGYAAGLAWLLTVGAAFDIGPRFLRRQRSAD
jgi:membrane-associated phospholipid phosphatase